MEGNFIEALKLMVIGMCTVFVVLGLVIALGNGLIKLINKVAPEEEKPQQAAAPQSVSPQVARAIAAAISMVTNGKGTAQKIEKL